MEKERGLAKARHTSEGQDPITPLRVFLFLEKSLMSKDANYNHKNDDGCYQEQMTPEYAHA